MVIRLGCECLAGGHVRYIPVPDAVPKSDRKSGPCSPARYSPNIHLALYERMEELVRESDGI
jgi:hypothetical protein